MIIAKDLVLVTNAAGYCEWVSETFDIAAGHNKLAFWADVGAMTPPGSLGVALELGSQANNWLGITEQHLHGIGSASTICQSEGYPRGRLRCTLRSRQGGLTRAQLDLTVGFLPRSP